MLVSVSMLVGVLSSSPPQLPPDPPGSVAAPGALQWESAGGCGDAATLRQRMQDLLGASGADDAQARVEVVPAGAVLGVSVEVTGPAGTNRRSFTAPDCPTAIEAAALVIAVDVDALATASSETVAAAMEVPEPEPEPVPEEEPVLEQEPLLEAEPEPVREPQSAAERERALGGFAIIEGGVGIGVLPGPSGVLQVGGGLRWRWLAGELLVSRHFPRTAGLPGDPSPEVEIGMWGASLRARFEPAVRTVSFPLHVGLTLGDMIGVGRGLAGARTRHALWGAAEVGGGIAWAPLPWLAIGARADLLLAFARPRFGAEGPGERQIAHEPGVVGFLGLAAVEVRF